MNTEWSDKAKKRLRGLSMRPGAVDPDELRAMVKWLENQRQDPKSYPTRSLHAKNKRPVYTDDRYVVRMSKGWVYHKLIPSFRSGDLDWVSQSWAIKRDSSAGQPGEADSTTTLERKKDKDVENVPSAITINRNVMKYSGEKSGASERDTSTEARLRQPGQGLPSGDFRRLELILSDIWVPDADRVPLDGYRYGEGFCEAHVDGRPFKWVQDTDKQAVLCWVDSETDSWLTDTALPMLQQHSFIELGSAWRELQEAMCRYLMAAEYYNFALNHGFGYTPIWMIEQARRSFNAINEDSDGVQEADFLIAEAPRLQGAVAQFRYQLQLALSALD